MKIILRPAGGQTCVFGLLQMHRSRLKPK
jgi:hypothetical protein